MEIEAKFGIAEAAEARPALAARVEAAGPGATLLVELTDAAATAPSLQLAAAARASLLARGGFGGFGPRAVAALGAADSGKGDAA